MTTTKASLFLLLFTVGACGGSTPEATTPPSQKELSPLAAQGVEITLAHGTAKEEQTRVQLTRLLLAHDLRPWLFTKKIEIDEMAIPHSHPVLTLHARHLKDDDQLLSTFIHEELHWWVHDDTPPTNLAVTELRRRFPDLPVGHPDGAQSDQSNYVHIPIILLEYEGLRRYVGDARANETFRFWEGDHYRTLYKLVRENRELITSIVIGDKLVPPFLDIPVPVVKTVKQNAP